jgi:hypothetical protein
MAVMKPETLVLRGAGVACDVVTSVERYGFNPANAGTAAGVLSFPRQLSLRDSRAGSDPRPRHKRTAPGGAGRAAWRAGRPAGPAGVPVRRRPARSAGRAILLGWPQAGGAAAPPDAWCLDRLTVRRTAPADQRIPSGYSQPFPRRTLPTGSLTSLPAGQRSAKRGQATPALLPALRMPLASTRGN